jgi:hypothetical protein
LGYDGDRASGFKINSQGPMATEKIAHFYPENPLQPPPAISGMYYYYNALAKLFRCNLVNKAGDDASVRGYQIFCCCSTASPSASGRFMAVTSSFKKSRGPP